MVIRICDPFSLSANFLFILACGAFYWTSATGEECSDLGKHFSSDKVYWTSVFVALAKQKNFKTADGKFVLSVCGKVPDARVTNDKAGLIDTQNATVIGRYDDVNGEIVTAPEDGAPVLYFRYNNGDSCASNKNRYGTVIAICQRGMKQPHLLHVRSNDTCAYTFILTTSLFCNVTRPASAPTAAPLPAAATPAVASAPVKRSSGLNAASGFLLFLLALACGYCIVGFLYKRYVLGARGAQQIPNYLFWVRVSRAIQDCVSNRPSNRYSTSVARTTEYDRANSADEQLMNDDEFKYDQPPLVVNPAGGQSSAFHQQQLNVASSSPNTPSVNAQRQQQPLLLPHDDPDDRLLQV